jgi:cell shape-determining protein MreC
VDEEDAISPRHPEGKRKYVFAEIREERQGWKQFVHSPLFVSLTLWLLTQAVVATGFVLTYLNRVSIISEWKGKVDTELERMNGTGTTYSHFQIEELKEKEAALEARTARVEDDTKHVDVLESENRRLTNDVEKLKEKK